MAGNPLRPGSIHAKTASQVQHRALTDRALVGETIPQQLIAQHPVHDQALPQGPLADHQLAHAQHRHGGLQDQRTWHDDFSPAIVDRR